jgi:peroxiredoxin
MLTLNRFRHPAPRAMARFAAGTSLAGEHARVADHVARCAECQALLRVAKRSEARLAEAELPPAPEALRHRIHQTLRRDGRVQHATSASVSRRARAPGAAWVVALAAAVVLCAALALFTSTERLTAGATTGELHFIPAAPAAGATIRVTYTPSEVLAGATRLRLRASYRTANDLPVPGSVRRAVAATLTRQADGHFRARFQLPASAVYATFAVEDEDGRHVDSNGRRLWTLLVHDADGRPRYEALEQQVSDLMDRNWELALATARRAAELYPDQIRAHVVLTTLEQSVLAPVAAESALATDKRRSAGFEQRLLAMPAPDPEEMGAMVNYAGMLGDTARAHRWRERLLRAHPHGLWGLNGVMGFFMQRVRTDPRGALAAIDSLWREDGNAHPGIVISGLTAAGQSGDTAAMRQWADRSRSLAAGQVDPVQVAGMLLRQPSLHEDGMRLLREQISARAHVDDALRPLDRTAADEARALREQQRSALTALGTALLHDGDMRAGLDTLILAARTGWDVTLFRRVATAALAAGDTATARDMLARVAVDPATPPAFADSARAQLGASTSDADPRWTRATTRAAHEMRSRMLERAVRRQLPASVHLARADGSTVELRDLTAQRPTVVAFWSRDCPHAIALLPAFARMIPRLEQQGYGVVLIMDEAPSEAVTRYVAAHGLSIPVHYDVRHEALLAFGHWGTPELYVVDGRGHVRYPLTRLPLVGAQLASLGGA